MEYAVPITIGVFLNAPSDIPGSLRRKVRGILISIVLTMLVTLIVSLARPHFWVLLAVITLFAFSISLLAVYGFRGSLVAFSGLLAMVFSLAHGISSVPLWMHVLLLGGGGLFYLGLSLLINRIIPKKDETQLLSDTLSLTGDYLAVRSELLAQTGKRDELLRTLYKLQSEISEKHEILRELLLTKEKRANRSHFDEKHLLIFISLVDIFELALANSLDYHKVDRLFLGHKIQLKKFIKVNSVFSEQLRLLSDSIITKQDIPSKEPMVTALTEANLAIQDYVNLVGLPQAREGAVMLKNLHDYQTLQLQKIRTVRRALANVRNDSKLSLKSKDAHQFITDQEYSFNIILQNLSIKSPIFRHSLRLTVAMILAYIFGTSFGITNTYWILLTLIVIMRPYYGLTKERSINRIIGTLAGAVIATIIIFLTQNPIVYGVLAALSLTMAFSLIQQSYRYAATFITINVIFVYSLLTPNALEIIQYRVLDTVLGAVLAVIANYLFWPSWEAMNLDKFLTESIRANAKYLDAIRHLYRTKQNSELGYKIPRKEAFLSVSNLNAAFQRMSQDPKSKQKSSDLIYEMVALNNTILSTLASLGTFIQNNKTTEESDNFRKVVSFIEITLNNAAQEIDQIDVLPSNKPENIDIAKENLKFSYDNLVMARETEIQNGNIAIEKEMLSHLQEAHLIYNQLVWLKDLSEKLEIVSKKYRKRCAE
ncbi:membrane protein [Arenibacter certesii]|uniref:Membrane protein n=2 Tax=Arenibacter certesii TaxID=228955 RepID=A0A918ISA9_9FLAO|nr:membrane protein [Arenibacter certesii]